ncbi:MAG: hypothetical protein E6J78_12535 [Deltaproteobacteria bacterium]|nr:MAG: hypothetical protein E6J78_12535 [Deltaproteobacteria bacterium]
MRTSAAMRRVTALLLVLMAASAPPAAAVELQDGKLSINGYGSWGYGATNLNDYLVAGHGGDFDSGDFALALTSRLSDRAVAAAQLHFFPERTGLSLDWAFGEWRFSDLLRVRAGVLKHPFGIFGEVINVGTLRPFFLIPSSVYGATEISGSGVNGLAFSGVIHPGKGWELSYDLYGGSLKLHVEEVISKVLQQVQGTLQPGGTLEIGVEETKYVLGGRLIASTPLEGFEVRLSAYGTPIREENGPRVVVGPSLQYTGEAFSARLEYFFFHETYQRAHAAYAEAAYFLTEKFQVGARAEIYHTTPFQAPIDSSLFEHRELAATFNYWFDPGLVVKLSFHAIDGNRFAFPVPLDDALLAGSLKRTTFASIAGVQFSF